jgi:hypothetical protein
MTLVLTRALGTDEQLVLGGTVNTDANFNQPYKRSRWLPGLVSGASEFKM